MNSKKSLLLIYHSKSGHTEKMARAVIEGVQDEVIDNVELTVKSPLDALASDVLSANGVIIGTPENFGYMSGAMKHFFDNIYYPCLSHTQGLPYAMFIRAGNDGQGALSSMQRIILGLAWREVAPAVIAAGEFDDKCLMSCRELGMTIAAGLDAGIF